MSDDLSLFGDDQPHEPVPSVPTELPIADWLVDALRDALTARGLTTMAERQQAIEAAAGRPVEALRTLTRAEALRILSSLASASETQPRTASAWDSREDSTWIDRL